MGRYFRSRGPFSVPRSPQGHPVLIQAGQSGRGQVFAAKWAEIVFVIHHSLEDAKREYASFKAAVAAAGRDPARVHVAPACYVCVGEAETVAQEKRAVIEATARGVDALVLLSEVLNYDFAKKPLDEPFSDEVLAELSFQGFRDRVIRHSGKKNPTVRDFITVSGRGTVKEHTMFCGSPQQVADQMEEWFSAPACDGFVLAASSMPGAYDDRAAVGARAATPRFVPKRTMSARHCATIWDWRYPGPPIGTRRAERLCDEKLCRCAILRHTHRVPSI
jgi:alkanesulfonate monooxygenase SsuD/methylene tetrahydromethanopterin reductase-like flavin-dependent oxidoreductase (luciferase family)